MAPNTTSGPTKRSKAASQSAFEVFRKGKQRVGTGLTDTLKEPPKAPPKETIPYYFPVYRIDWVKLQEWMVKRFPAAEFSEVVSTIAMSHDLDLT